MRIVKDASETYDSVDDVRNAAGDIIPCVCICDECEQPYNTLVELGYRNFICHRCCLAAFKMLVNTGTVPGWEAAKE